MNIDRFGIESRMQMIGLVKKLTDEGLSCKSIANRLCVSESTVRAVKRDIENSNVEITTF